MNGIPGIRIPQKVWIYCELTAMAILFGLAFVMVVKCQPSIGRIDEQERHITQMESRLSATEKDIGALKLMENEYGHDVNGEYR